MRPKNSDILTKAAAICEAGWVQGKYHEDGCFCMFGAIAIAAGDKQDDIDMPKAGPAVRAVEAAVGNIALETWNDAKGRTQAEVVAMLRRVAEQEQEREAGR